VRIPSRPEAVASPTGRIDLRNARLVHVGGEPCNGGADHRFLLIRPKRGIPYNSATLKVALAPGTRLGAYAVVSLLGEGGMGEVYRARDIKLNRDVALKVLPDAFALDADRLARFKREAQVLASLNHPHIAHIYGLEGQDGRDGSPLAIVMELVEGPTLADRIAQGLISIDEALPIAKQIADALEAAHERGVIHRDLKPANIKLRPDGMVKVLDFGLAKALEPAVAMSPQVTNSPTITTPAMMTGVGTILGTAAYMAPEQAKGRPADRRSDVWAFGCVLFEMLTGRRAFEGEDVSDTLAAILRGDPNWQALPRQTPSPIDTLLRKCLEKDASRRLGSMSTAQFLLSQASGAPPVAKVSVVNWRERALWIVALAVLVTGATLAVARRQADDIPLPVIQFQVEPPPGEFFNGAQGAPRFSVSPDGQAVVFDSSLPGKRDHLWMRRLDSPVLQPLRATETASVQGLAVQGTFWSADSRYIGFFDEPAARLKKLDVRTGAVQNVIDVPGNQYGGTWNTADIILFASSETRGLQRVSPNGGTPVQVTSLDKSQQDTSHLWPVFLPDGRHFLYHVIATGRRPAVYLGLLNSPTRTKLVESDFAAQFAPPDTLLYVRGQSLLAQRLDLEKGVLRGTPVLVAESVLGTNMGRLSLSASNTGVIVYANGTPDVGRMQLTWFDRSGNSKVPVGPPIGSAGLRLAPDGRRVAIADIAAGATLPDIWIYDADRDVNSRLTTNPAVDSSPVWSPDGSRLVFRSNRGQVNGLYEVPASGAVSERLLLQVETAILLVPLDWSSDGRLLIFKRGRDIWVMPMDGDHKPVPYLTTPFNEAEATLSPNGQWVAYVSDEAGTNQVFVQSFPDPLGGKVQVSSKGGARPRWSRSGRELFYLTLDGVLTAVPVTTNGRFSAGQAAPLFQTPLSLTANQNVATYDVSADGQRFLLSVPRELAKSPPLNVVMNWASRITDPAWRH
jgi:eukaryotic-like serine/threonine-protein kinase